ncbi:MAG TPA: metallophosphoesterase [Spirochaetia bacterium]|nr:metallophosphoesterase [Spirochaetia bacterium]
MKILCVADHIDPLVYSNNIKNRFKEVDIIIGAGDLPLSYYDFIMSCLNKPLLFVFGNHHLQNISLYRKTGDTVAGQQLLNHHTYAAGGGVYINRRIKRIKNILIGGLGGTRWYNGGVNQYSELQMYFKIASLLPRLLWNRLVHGRFLDILITHAAPFGIGDRNDPCHRGFKAFLWLMRAFRPKFLIHGHIHLYEFNAKREYLYHQTKIINAYDHCIVQTEDQP